jgi:hypothetical protein
MFVYPKASQTHDQQLIDESDCYNSAQTGVANWQSSGLSTWSSPRAGGCCSIWWGRENVFAPLRCRFWVKQAIDAWTTAANITKGRFLRPVNKGGKVVGEALTDWSIWSVVENWAKEIGIEHFGAHDLRRTCAKLCRKNGGDLEQIKSYLDTPPSRPRSATWAPHRSFSSQSTTIWDFEFNSPLLTGLSIAKRGSEPWK